MRKHEPIMTRAKFEKLIAPLGLTADRGPAWKFKLSPSDRPVCAVLDGDGKLIVWGKTWWQAARRLGYRFPGRVG